MIKSAVKVRFNGIHFEWNSNCCYQFFIESSLYSQVPNRPHCGKKFKRLENDIVGGKATEICLHIKAIDIWLSALLERV